MSRFFNEPRYKKFSKVLRISIIYSLLVLILGIFLFFYPILANNIINKIMGCVFMVEGLTLAYKYIMRDKAKLYSLNLIMAIIFLVMGLFIIFSHFTIDKFITSYLGIYLILQGCCKISYCVWLKVGNDKSWFITFVVGIFLIIFGFVVIYNPFSFMVITKVVGLFLGLYSLLDIADLFFLRKRVDEIAEIFW